MPNKSAPARLLAALLALQLACTCGRVETRTAAALRRHFRQLQDVDAAACAAAWSLPYARAAQLPPGYPPAQPGGDNAPLRLSLFLLYQVDPPIAIAALRSLRSSSLAGERGLALNVTVVDNSAARDLSDGADAATRQALAELGPRLRVHTPLVPLDFQRSQNTVQELAYAERCDAFYVMHSDAELQPGGAEHLMPLARALVRQRWRPPSSPEAQPAGMVYFTRYDALVLFNPAATLKTGVWDINFGVGYGADVDYYHRISLAGFSTPNEDDVSRIGPAVAALGRRVNVTHEGSHSLKSKAFACSRELRMTLNFEGEWLIP